MRSKQNHLICSAITVIVFILLPSFLKSQSTVYLSQPQVNTFQRGYISAPTESVYGAEQTSDSGYVVTGQVYSFGIPAVSPDVYVQKTDKYGNVQWTKNYGTAGMFAFDRGSSIHQTNDGGYIVSGALAGAGGDMYLLKLNAAGTLVWSKGYGDFFLAGSTEQDAKVIETNDGGFLMTSSTDSSGSSNDIDIVAVKTDSLGTVQWTRIYDSFADKDESASALAATADGGYIISGQTNVITANQDVILIKTNSNGDTLWTGIYDLGLAERVVSVQQTTDGGYIVTGTAVDPAGAGYDDAFFLKTDSLGTTQWAKQYGNVNDQEGGYFGQQTDDGGYMFGGYTGLVASFNWFYLLVKTDMNGDTLWTKRYGDNTYHGLAWAGQQTNDKGYILSGTISLAGNAEVFLVKTDSLGNSGCLETANPLTVVNRTTTEYNRSYKVLSASNTKNPATVSGTLASTDQAVCCHVPLILAGDTTVCLGSSVTINASGAFSYLWSTGATTPSITVSPSVTTIYSVTGLNGPSSCTVLSITVTVNSTPTINASGTTTICSGSNTVLTANGATTYSWAPATGLSATTGVSVTASPTATITYTVTGTTACGTDVTTITVNVDPAPSLTASGSNNISCVSASSTLTGTSAGSTMVWNGGVLVNAPDPATVTAAGTYTVTATNPATGCTSTTTVTITSDTSPPVISGASGNNITCAVTSSTLTGTSAGSTMVWNGGTLVNATNPATVTAAGTYTVTATNSANGCTSTATVTITANTTPPNITGGPTLALTCAGTSGVISSSSSTSGVTYNWSGPGIVSGGTTSSPTVNAAGTYTVTVTDPVNGCTNTSTVNVTQPPAITASISTIAATCGTSNGSASVTASGGTGALTYSWTPGGATTSIITGIPSGSYSVIITDASGCTQSASGTVGSIALPVDAGSDVTIVSGGSTTLSGTSSSGASYSWSPSGSLSCDTCQLTVASPTVTTTYTLTVTVNGCSSMATVTVFVETFCGELFVPNAFSPNGDNENDVLKIYGDCITDLEFVIYDRWGEKVFETTDPVVVWDGRYKGNLMDTGVFAYYLNAKVKNTEVKKHGNITLVK